MADKTSPDKDQQRVLRDLRHQGQAALTWGLPNPASEAAVVGMGLLLRDQLGNTGNTSRASAAAALASTMLDKTTAKMPQAAAIACARGCSHCCHSTVSVSAPEVFRIVGLINREGDRKPGLDAASVRARAKARSAATLQAVLAKKDACPLLIDNACAVHDVRPIGCRQYVSVSADDCRRALEGSISAFPFVPAGVNAGLIVRSLLLGATKSLGLDAEIYELSSALDAALAEPDSEQRWLAGENVLSAAMKMEQPPNMQGSVQRWSGMLTGLVT